MDNAWTFDAENDDIMLEGAPVFRVYRADDFPCIEDEDRTKADLEYLTHAQVVVMLLNALGNVTDEEPTVGHMIRKLVREQSNGE